MKKLETNQLMQILGGDDEFRPKQYNCTEGLIALAGSLAGIPTLGSAVKKGWLCAFGWAPPWID